MLLARQRGTRRWRAPRRSSLHRRLSAGPDITLAASSPDRLLLARHGVLRMGSSWRRVPLADSLHHPVGAVRTCHGSGRSVRVSPCMRPPRRRARRKPTGSPGSCPSPVRPDLKPPAQPPGGLGTWSRRQECPVRGDGKCLRDGARAQRHLGRNRVRPGTPCPGGDDRVSSAGDDPADGHPRACAIRRRSPAASNNVIRRGVEEEDVGCHTSRMHVPSCFASADPRAR